MVTNPKIEKRIRDRICPEPDCSAFDSPKDQAEFLRWLRVTIRMAQNEALGRGDTDMKKEASCQKRKSL